MAAIIGFAVAVVWVASSFLVAQDSEKYDWSLWKHPTRTEWNSAADSYATWLVACLTLWPVFFPGYFWDRKYAPRKAP